jgi:regulator of protease activity HflC (stomatin/prohibitin superfamily)
MENTLTILILFMLPVYVVSLSLSKGKRVYLTDYTRGLYFVKGAFSGILRPGSYRPFITKQQIEIVDIRPQPIFLEKLSYRDACQNASMLSMGAEIAISDARLAVSMLKVPIDDSIPIVRDTVRSVVSRTIADDSPEYRSKTAADILQAVNSELDRVGMKISNVEVVELWSRPGLIDNKSTSN